MTNMKIRYRDESMRIRDRDDKYENQRQMTNMRFRDRDDNYENQRQT